MCMEKMWFNNVLKNNPILQNASFWYSIDVLEKMCRQSASENWFAKFRCGNFDVEGAPRSGKPVEADIDTIKALVDGNWQISTREIDERVNLLNSTVYDHLKKDQH